ncbi:MAG: VCBS repeat-containing protein, partial [Blastocatellia bacterium]
MKLRAASSLAARRCMYFIICTILLLSWFSIFDGLAAAPPPNVPAPTANTPASHASATMSPPSPGASKFDFDGDGKADIGVWRPSTGNWLIINSSNGQPATLQLGVSTDQPVPADYDGDGKTDAAVWRPSTGVWYIMNPDHSVRTVGWGDQGDTPVAADYDGDGKADVAIYRSSTAGCTWYIINSSNSSTKTLGWGINGDKPVPADFDGDGQTDIAVWRPSNGTWYIKRSSNNNDLVKSWGVLGDIPAPENYDPDPKDDYAVWRPTNSGWYILSSFDEHTQTDTWGASSDTPVPADYDGDGRADIAVFRPIGSSTGTWYIKNSSDNSIRTVGWGLLGDVPLPRVAGAQSSPPGPPAMNLSSALSDPINRTGVPGEDLYSGNFNWSLPLLGLAGRAGLDLGLSLSYNSLVWTKVGSTITFNADNSFPTPGFHLGFPSIQSQTYVSQSGKNALLMIMPSGARIELRQVVASLYESADSSWMELDTSASPLILRTADGSQLRLQLFSSEYQCTQVKDRNGNFITINHDSSGRITTIRDTLDRTITFVYANNNLQKITQPWNGVE